MSDKVNISGRLLALSGITCSVLIIGIGFWLSSIGREMAPFGEPGVMVSTVTLALTFGYNLGLSLRKGEPEPIQFIFFSWFLGTFVIFLVLLIIAKLSGFLSNIAIPIFPMTIVLIAGTAFPATLVVSGAIESHRLRYLKASLDVTRTHMASLILGGYVMSVIFGRELGALLTAIFYLLTIFRRKLMWWKKKTPPS